MYVLLHRLQRIRRSIGLERAEHHAGPDAGKAEQLGDRHPVVGKAGAETRILLRQAQDLGIGHARARIDDRGARLCQTRPSLFKIRPSLINLCFRYRWIELRDDLTFFDD